MKKIFYLQLILLFSFTLHAQNWLTTGNSLLQRNNFIGSTDTSAFVIKSNNVISAVLYPYNSNTSFGAGSLNASAFTKNPTVPHYTYTGNTAFGYYALTNTSNTWNTGVGFEALYWNTNGVSNTAVGYAAMLNNTTGGENIGIGKLGLYGNTTGNYNVGVGGSTLSSTTASYYNTAVGAYAAASYDQGWNNVFLGANTRTNGAGFYNVIAIGQDVTITGVSQVRIGNPATTTVGSWAYWSNFSDGRYKKDVKSNVKGLDFIMKLNPVTYRLNATGIDSKLHEGVKREANPYQEKALKDKENIVETGFIAQEVEKAAKEADFDFSGVDKPQNANDFYGLRYAEFVVPLVKSVQEQQQMIDELKRQNADLLKRVTELEKNAGQTPSKDALNIYPNPAYKKVFVNIISTKASVAHVKLYDSKGSLLKQKNANLVAGNNEVSFDIADLPKGVFMLSADWDNGNIKQSGELVK